MRLQNNPLSVWCGAPRLAENLKNSEILDMLAAVIKEPGDYDVTLEIKKRGEFARLVFMQGDKEVEFEMDLAPVGHHITAARLPSQG